MRKNRTGVSIACILCFACVALSACDSSNNDAGSGSLGSDQGEYLHFINNTYDRWWVEYGSGSHSDQYTINNQKRSISDLLNKGNSAYMGWQGSRTNPWSQIFNLNNLSQMTIYGYNNNPHCTNEIVDPTQSGDIWICPDNKYSVAAAVQYMSPPGKQGYGYWGFVEFRDKHLLPPYTDWMGAMPDYWQLKVGDLSIPGSHDTASHNCHQTAKCQDMGFADQMNWGARAFDLRLSENMNFWHGDSTGKCFCGYTLDDFLNSAISFLNAHPQEFIIALVKDENCSGSTFTANFDTVINRHGRENFIISMNVLNLELSELRKKIIIVTRKRSANTCGYVNGAPQIDWPENTSKFPTSISGCDGLCIPAGISDDYGDWPRTKMGQGGLLDHLHKASIDSQSNWFIGFVSGYDLGDSCQCSPVDYAQATNPALWEYLLGGDGYVNRTCGDDQSAKATGWISTISPSVPAMPDRDANLGTVMMDFLGSYNTNDIRNDLIRRNLGY